MKEERKAYVFVRASTSADDKIGDCEKGELSEAQRRKSCQEGMGFLQIQTGHPGKASGEACSKYTQHPTCPCHHFLYWGNARHTFSNEKKASELLLNACWVERVMKSLDPSSKRAVNGNELQAKASLLQDKKLERRLGNHGQIKVTDSKRWDRWCWLRWANKILPQIGCLDDTQCLLACNTIFGCKKDDGR